MPAEDSHRPEDPDALQREGERQHLDGLRERVSVAETEASQLRERLSTAVRWASELAKAQAELAKAKAELAATQERLSELERQLALRDEELARTRERQLRSHASWARAAREIQRSQSWRVGHFLARAFRLLTFRRPRAPGGPGELAARIESAGVIDRETRGREHSTAPE